jgi:DNA-binding transcriptional LysR family regulator
LLDFTRYPLVMQVMPPLYQEWLRGIELAVAGQKPGAAVHVAHTCSDYSVLCRMTLDSDAIMVGPEQSIASGPYQKCLQQVDFPLGPPDVSVAAAHMQVPPPSPLARRFIALMRKEAASDHPRYPA